jgi:hypothetical protein
MSVNGDDLTHLNLSEQLARIDQMHADIQLKQEQLRQLRSFEHWRLFFAGLTAVAIAAGVAGGGVAWTLARMVP